MICKTGTAHTSPQLAESPRRSKRHGEDPAANNCMILNSALTQVLRVGPVPLAASSPYIVENGTKIFDVSQHITKGRIRSCYFKEELWTNFNDLQLATQVGIGRPTR